ncbi:unnamed protein product [Dibothriocephalus latus]|uniref:Uncharacterized protein n=1 Tax=Dibothriocephalus latus TaxID=60516 RepID=A0A3P7LDY0_DIBLA|nr:unnamed protein product [Dibothriocephalus latus]
MQANPRYRGENILTLDLDLPCRTTLEYEPPQLAPQVIAALEAALQDEEALELDGRFVEVTCILIPLCTFSPYISMRG